MTHIFRKYGKAIMAVLSSLLMITFVLGSFSKGGSGQNAAGMVKGTMDGKKVTMADLYRASQDLEVLQGMLTVKSDSSRDQMYGFPENELGLNMFILNRMLDPHEKTLHMYLLLQEAQQYGLTIPAEDVERVIRDAKINDEDYANFLDKQNISENVVKRAVADLLTIRNLDEFAVETLPVSVPELEHLAVDTTAAMQVRYIALDTNNADQAKKDWTPAPPDQEKQFTAYKGMLPFDTDDANGAQPPLIDGHHYPFGYKFPDRIKLEVLTFNRQQIRDSIKPSIDDYAQAYEEYKQHPENYQTKVPDTQPDTKIGPTTSPAGPTTRPFEEVRADIFTKILERRTDDKMKQMTDFANSALKATWDRFQNNMDAHGFYAVPPDQWPNYETIAGDIEKQFQVRPKVEAFGRTWFTRKTLPTNLKNGIGGAYLFSQGRPTDTFLNLAMNVHELQPAQQGLIASLHLQVGVDGPVVMDVNERYEPKNAYIYRVTEASPSHEPATLDEVQPAVIHDLRRLALLNDNLRQAHALAQEAAHAGLDTVARRHKLDILLTPEFTRLRPGRMNPMTGAQGEPVPMAIEHLGVVPEFTNAAFDLLARSTQARQNSPTLNDSTSSVQHSSLSTSATTRASSSLPSTQPTTASQDSTFDRQAVVAVDSLLEAFVLELYNSKPATIASFDEQRASLRYTARGSEVSRFLHKWHTLQETAKRTHFVPSDPFKQTQPVQDEIPDVPSF